MVLFLIIGAGMVASLQIGKAIIAFPIIQTEMSLSLVEVSALLSTFALFGATIAMPSGVVIPRLGAKRALLLGLALISVGNVFGLLSVGFAWLLASRFVEGIGFIVIATAAPVLLGRVTRPETRAQVFAVWGIYMPAGMGLMILAGLVFDVHQWRVLWLVNAVLAAAWFAAALWVLPADPQRLEGGRETQAFETVPSLLGQFWRDRRPFLVAAAFFFYGNLYFAVVGLFPTFLIARFGMGIDLVAPLTAIIVLANVLGNLAAGILLRRGFAFHRVIAAAFASAAILCMMIFLVPRTAFEAVVLGSLAFGIAGLVPASVMASAALLTRDLSYVGAMIGLFMQGSTLGQFTGPPLFSYLVETFGWTMSWPFLAIAGMLGVSLAVAVGRMHPVRPSVPVPLQS